MGELKKKAYCKSNYATLHHLYPGNGKIHTPTQMHTHTSLLPCSDLVALQSQV